MNDSNEDLRGYLLGTLPERDAEQIEQRLLEDEAFFQQVLQVEDELLDEFAAGILPESLADRMQARLSVQPKLQERLRLRKALIQQVRKTGASRSRWTTWLPIVAAACLTYVTSRSERGQSAAKQIASPRAGWLPVVAAACLVLAAGLAVSRARSSVMFFPAFVARGATTLPQLAAAPPRPVALQFQTPGLGTFDVALVNQSGSFAVRLGGVRATELGGVAFVTIWLDTGTLGPGTYTVQLSPAASNNSSPPASWTWEVREANRLAAVR